MPGDPKTRVLTDEMFVRLLWSMASHGVQNDAVLRWCCRELFWSEWPDPNAWPSPGLDAAQQLQQVTGNQMVQMVWNSQLGRGRR